MSMRLTVRDVLRKAGVVFEKNGRLIKFTCPDPAHADNDPSANIYKSSQGNERVKCQSCGGNWGPLDLAKLCGIDVDSWQPREVVAYPYTDESGTVLFEQVRFEPKDFRARVPQADGSYRYTLNGTRRVLYRLPEVLEAAKNGERIILAEGEKDADALRRLGFVATCNPFGAGKWSDDYRASLEGAADVCIIADADKAGREHAQTVAESVSQIVPVTVLELPEANDAAEWIGNGGTADALRALLDESPAFAATSKATIRRTSWTAAELLATEFPEPRWAVEPIIAEGLNVLASPPKSGKSWLALATSIAVAAGGRALGKLSVERGEAMYLALEDPPRRLRQRLTMLLQGASPPEGLYLETAWPKLGDGGEEKLRAWLLEHPACRLLTVDVLAKIRPRVSDRADRYSADYAALEPLKDLADEFGVSVVVLHHTRKATSEDFVDLVLGTQGLAGGADATLVLRRARGQADAELHVTGRDIEERAYALRFDPLVGSWGLMGDAAEFAIGETRRSILDVLRSHGALTPKQVAEVSDIGHELAKKSLQRMLVDGQVTADEGRYSIPSESDPLSAVPGVPQSLSLPAEGQGDAGDARDATPDEEPLTVEEVAARFPGSQIVDEAEAKEVDWMRAWNEARSDEAAPAPSGGSRV